MPADVADVADSGGQRSRGLRRILAMDFLREHAVASGNYAFFPVAAPCFWMKTLIFSRSEVAADAGLNPKHAFRKSKS